MKKCILWLMLLCLLVTAVPQAQARESLDVSRTGSMTFLFVWEDTPLDTGNLTLTRVGDIVRTHFEWIPQLRDSGLSLKNPEDRELAGKLAAAVQEREIAGITAPIEDGKAVFTDLATGLYLVTQQEACEGFDPVSPFLISLPRLENGSYVYDISAQPKVGLEPLPTEPTETDPTSPTDPQLPQTGQMNWPVPAMAVAGLAMLVLGLYLCFGKKNRHEN